ASMRATNAAAARIVLQYQPHAATDVTGFGLAGHLLEMLEASDVSATLRADAIPALPGARTLADHGVESTMAAENRARLKGFSAHAEHALLVDPQTSGGLLVGVNPVQAIGCLQALLDAGLTAAVIGEVEPAKEGDSRLRLE
ncbi:MAG: hypothetical protein INR62_10405, partial [Rhodospirillales bacterium]|nr:hypothetical protein [Acetobacter sp.]